MAKKKLSEIYVVYSLNIGERTEESFELERNLEKIKCGIEEEFYEYKKRKLKFNKYAAKFQINCIDETAYFLDFKEAQKNVVSNTLNIHEDIDYNNIYNYVCIMSYEANMMYGACASIDFNLYKYNEKTEQYEIVDEDEDIYCFVLNEMTDNTLLIRKRIIV